ncbi:hypothetical protein EV137_2692 [Kribbella pratensis]|uniref:Uncharacterized protein n=1 Tax=Kribbella pratensis TaxID=2512112 RepID=A0ABY2FQD3_9ACTN|nr:hypothetical protein EV137_2692 [Kribbella pratensis]
MVSSHDQQPSVIPHQRPSTPLQPSLSHPLRVPNPNLRQLPQPLSNSPNQPHLLGSPLHYRGARAGGLILNRSFPVNHTNLPGNFLRVLTTARQVGSAGSISPLGWIGQGFRDAWLVFAQLAGGLLPTWSARFIGRLGYTGFKRNGRLVGRLVRQWDVRAG